jgi:hypothetical protein
MPGLIRGVARTAVIAGTATAVSNGVSRRQYGRWEQQAQQQQAQEYAQQQYAAQQYAAQQQALAAQAAPAQAPVDPTIAKLQELASLHAQGILSDEEFSAAKAKVLGV